MSPDQLRASLVARYEHYVMRSEEGCWDWRMPVGSTLQYPTLGTGKFGTVLVHRLSYELHVGPIPEGVWVLHHCDNKRCSRPDHLYLGDQSDNGADIRNRRTSLKAHCRRGHLKTAANTYVRVDKRGYVERHCEDCRRERYRASSSSSSSASGNSPGSA